MAWLRWEPHLRHVLRFFRWTKCRHASFDNRNLVQLTSSTVLSGRYPIPLMKQLAHSLAQRRYFAVRALHCTYVAHFSSKRLRFTADAQRPTPQTPNSLVPPNSQIFQVMGDEDAENWHLFKAASIPGTAKPMTSTAPNNNQVAL